MRRAARTLALAALAALAPLGCGHARAADPRIVPTVRETDLPAEKRTASGLYLTALEAARYLRAFRDIVLVDIRYPLEVRNDGLPGLAARNIPLYLPHVKRPGAVDELIEMETNRDFVAAIVRLLDNREHARSTTLFLICWRGTFSAHAAAQLSVAGFDNVYTIVDGTLGDPQHPGDKRYPGWRAAGLPWRMPPLPSQLYEAPHAAP